MGGELTMNDVYINRLAKYLPNDPVSNDEMEAVLGMVNHQPSRARKIVLRQNGIKTRYYAINKQGQITHNNAQLTAEAVKKLTDEEFTLNDIQLLCCGTTSPDQLVPSHASMVHGILKNRALEINSPSGVCCSGMQAFKYGYMSIKCGDTSNAVCTGSETASFALCSHKFQKEMDNLRRLEQEPVLAFEKDFLRWMLSDGAGGVLMEDRPRGRMSLRVEWVENVSFANELGVCMFGGCERQTDDTVRSFHTFDFETVGSNSMMTLQQDVRLLKENIVQYAVKALTLVAKKRNIAPCEADYFLPHLSSEFFRKPLAEEMKRYGVGVPRERWFTNLDRVGNVGAASIYLALEELVNSGRLEKGQRIWIAVPESARFMYMQALVTVRDELYQ
jgi:3-oxoacyl-[acyl-carrier-protein] synthase III